MHFQKPMLGVPLDWSNPLNDGLVMHLAMNEGHGDKVRDLSMNGNHGTLNNMAFPPTAASGWNPGRNGIGLNFDGTSDYVDCGTNASLNLGNDDFTISSWVSMGVSKAALQMIAAKYDGGDVGWFICVRDNGFINVKYGAGVARQITSDAACISVDTWHHIVFSHNISKDILYVDGVNIKEQASFNDNVNAAHATWVGLWDTLYLDGAIDQTRIHNRALTAKEVREYYINPWQVYLDKE